MKKEVKSLCRMCDDHCGINVHVENNEIVDIQGNKDHVWNQGRLCIKGRAGVDFVNAPDRIRKPLKRTENGWEEISLEQALTEIAEKTKEIQAKYGDQTMSVWKGEAVGFAQQEEIARRFIHAIGSPNYFSNDSACFVGRWIGYSLMYGRWNAQPDFENSKCMVLWGANPPHAHPNMTQQINRGREKGATLVVIDSRRSAIARQADHFVQVLPGTDGAFAWGLMRELINNDMLDHDFIRDYTEGFEKIKEYAQSFTYDFVAKETGTDAHALIPVIAKKMFQAAPAVVNYVGNGLEHHENGINNIRAVACFDGLLAAVDATGGNYTPVGFPLKELTLYHEKPLKELKPIGADRFPVLYDFRQECHTMMAMNTMINNDPYPLKGMIILGANPVISNPNTAKVIEAMKALELLVVRELYMSETAELAHYILPAASYLERSEIHIHGGFQTVTCTPRAIEPTEGMQDEYQFFHDLAHKLDAGSYFPWANEDELNAWLVSDSGVTIEEIKACENGYNYAAKKDRKFVEAAKTGKAFNTPSGKLEFASEYLKNLGYQEIPEYIAPVYNTEEEREYPYTLITGARKVMYLHGRNRNFKRLVTACPQPEIELHPSDAKKIGVVTGDTVKVTSMIGSIEIPVTVMHETEIKEGVTQITHGWKHANVNYLTHDDIFDPIDGFPLMKAVQIKVEKIEK